MAAITRQHPSSQEITLAKQSGQSLARLASRDQTLRLSIGDAEEEQLIELPMSAVQLLREILATMATGQGVMVIPENTELTTVQAAEILNVSRPFLIKLLDEKVLPYRKVGKHRRIRIEDVIAYKDKIDIERQKILDELVAEAQELDMGY